jgi:hypothetical protein
MKTWKEYPKLGKTWKNATMTKIKFKNTNVFGQKVRMSKYPEKLNFKKICKFRARISQLYLLSSIMVLFKKFKYIIYVSKFLFI